MTTFIDGPAAGKRLMLRRAPYFLRVVEKDGEIDALDQLDDTPAADEKIYVYRLTKPAGWMHINKRGGGGIYACGEYKLVADQPSDQIMRETAWWRGWTEQQPVGFKE